MRGLSISTALSWVMNSNQLNMDSIIPILAGSTPQIVGIAELRTSTRTTKGNNIAYSDISIVEKGTFSMGFADASISYDIWKSLPDDIDWVFAYITVNWETGGIPGGSTSTNGLYKYNVENRFSSRSGLIVNFPLVSDPHLYGHQLRCPDTAQIFEDFGFNSYNTKLPYVILGEGPTARLHICPGSSQSPVPYTFSCTMNVRIYLIGY